MLRVEHSGKVEFHHARFAAWSAQDAVAGPLDHSSKDPAGCRPLRQCRGCALLALQGGCTFVRKARNAEAAGYKLLVVASATGPALHMGAEDRRPSIAAVSISKTSGRRLLLAWAHSPRPPTISVSAAAWDWVGELCIGVMAVGLVVWGAHHSIHDLRHPGILRSISRVDVLAVEESSGFQFVLFGSALLTLLFFFMKYLIYLLLVVFASAAVSSTATLLEPLIAAQRPSLRARAYRLPKWTGAVLGSLEHSWADALAEGIGMALAALFLVFRNRGVGWLLQDTIAALLLLTIQRTLRLPNLRVGTLLLVCTFFFDIFWVFLSPLVFQKSVMIEVATGGGTGQSVPMVLKVPSMSASGGFKILGLGDIAIPGLLVSLLLRHDMTRRVPACRGYFLAGVLGYALGLVLTFVSLHVTKHGQPALLFLVPGTLAPTFAIACCKGELGLLWSASYYPEPEAEDYQMLAGPDGEA